MRAYQEISKLPALHIYQKHFKRLHGAKAVLLSLCPALYRAVTPPRGQKHEQRVPWVKWVS